MGCNAIFVQYGVTCSTDYSTYSILVCSILLLLLYYTVLEYAKPCYNAVYHTALYLKLPMLYCGWFSLLYYSILSDSLFNSLKLICMYVHIRMHIWMDGCMHARM